MYYIYIYSLFPYFEQIDYYEVFLKYRCSSISIFDVDAIASG